MIQGKARRIFNDQEMVRVKDVEIIAIDEFAYQKGHKYQTVVYDLIKGRIIYVGQGRAEESLEKFFERLRHSGATIRAVAMDMWLPYFNVVILVT